MILTAEFTNIGGAAQQFDRLASGADDGGATVWAVLCDGLNGSRCGDAVAELLSASCLSALRAGSSAAEAVRLAARALDTEQQHSLQLKGSASTIAALELRGSHCRWANIGDTRLYHFSEMALRRTSIDDTALYRDYLNGRLAYADIRLKKERSRLNAALGDGSKARPHEADFELSAGDALLLCSDGFWEYVFEEEMLIDLARSETAEDWLQSMLLRCARRSLFEGDNLTAFCLICRDAIARAGTYERKDER